MNRRKFGLMAGSALAAPAMLQPAMAQSAPDPTLLTTTLTPFGSERAGNADGSIPAWSGGISAPPLPPTSDVNVPMFDDEKPLYTVDASNLAQYADLLTAGTQLLMTKFGMHANVYQCHRTAAAPQWFYDNTAKNVTRAVLEPSGGRFGFTGGYGGVPFPIIDTADPLAGGAQLIWNHLLNWDTFEQTTRLSMGYVVTGNSKINTIGVLGHTIFPFFDPNGSPETYDGYYYKMHAYFILPESSRGQEDLTWHTSNQLIHPDITWSLVNGQGRVRKAPDEAYDTPNPSANGIGNFDDSSCFSGNPQKYDWKVLGKREMLVPYNCNRIRFTPPDVYVQPGFPNPDIVRWEKHRVWVVEATLHPGERNTTARRMCYIDEDTYLMVLTDSYDSDNNMVKTAVAYNRCVPSLPGTIENGYALWETNSGDYTVIGYMAVPGYDTAEYLISASPEVFDAQEMAASASF
jgi:hypothetical protein